MRAPAFWWRERSPAATLLRPAALVYGSVAGSRMRRPGSQAAVPVICVGNFTAGGAGKTPTSLAIATILRDLGETPMFLTRGYGGTLRGPVQVDPQHHTAKEVGDEPLLLARTAPTIVSRDRPAGARLCAEAGASLIVMDDGLQNPTLAKDASFAVVDGTTGLGNGLCLPAGPLRAPMADQWPRTDAVIVVGSGQPGERIADEAKRHGAALFRARLVPDTAGAARLAGLKVLAFTGIGRPDKFFATLRECGAAVAAERPFPDHHPFTPHELQELAREAERSGLSLVTTEKDWVRVLAAGGPDLAKRILSLPVQLQFDDEGGLQTFLKRRVAQADRRLNRSSARSA